MAIVGCEIGATSIPPDPRFAATLGALEGRGGVEGREVEGRGGVEGRAAREEGSGALTPERGVVGGGSGGVVGIGALAPGRSACLCTIVPVRIGGGGTEARAGAAITSP